MLGVTIRRDAPIRLHPFTQYFQGFERVEAVRRIFGDRTEEVLEGLQVEFFSSRFGFMGVSPVDGHLIVSTHYLKTGEERDLYLDVIHELVHVRQFQEGSELFPDDVAYADRPTEIEAYAVAVEEARRLGMGEAEIREYLEVPWMDEKDHARLVANLGVEAAEASEADPPA